MSLAEIVKELPMLKRGERRELARRIFEVEDEEAAVLSDCDRRADERFQMLDAMEAEAPTPAEVWMVDLGMVAKVRPCLILSDYPAPDSSRPYD